MERHTIADTRKRAQFVQMQLVRAMRDSLTAFETGEVADAMAHARLHWEGVIREEQRLGTDEGGVAFGGVASEAPDDR